MTKLDRKVMPGVGPGYPRPYTEALTLEEANNELALLATGNYGKMLPPQLYNGYGEQLAHLYKRTWRPIIFSD